jgi:hypothetical protein
MTDAWLEELSYDDCLQRLREHTVGRIGVVIHYAPVVLPVNYRLVETSASPWSHCAPVPTMSSKAAGRRPRSRSTTSIRSMNRAGPCSYEGRCTTSTQKQPTSNTASTPTHGSLLTATPGSSSSRSRSPGGDCIPAPANGRSRAAPTCDGRGVGTSERRQRAAPSRCSDDDLRIFVTIRRETAGWSVDLMRQL